MKPSLMILVLIFGIIIVASCKKSEEVKIEEEQTHSPKNEGMAEDMKNASLQMRRLAKAVNNNDWVEMEMWTRELKEGVGFSCVRLYMAENGHIPKKFMLLNKKFNSAINKLILCSKTHDVDNSNPEFNNLIRSCDSCHESFNKDAEAKLDFTG
jgi:hypothetical protein